mmetsp:Transcript_155999/g.500243  ORF Transcript_155999/g.500243 Transcript_155999/m.500243 type:complete len:220 (+) Transcript_155999:310-969(+)
MTCTASISKLESPNETRFVMILESSFRCTSKKAWIFHLPTSPGKCGSYFVRADITSIFCNIGSRPGTHFAALYSTQPNIALVMIKVCPSLCASSNSLAPAASISRRCRSTAGSRAWSCRKFKKEVHNNVSSQSKMITVWCFGGLWACGTQTFSYDNFLKKFTLKSSWLFKSRNFSSRSRGGVGRLPSCWRTAGASEILEGGWKDCTDLQPSFWMPSRCR